jgi:DNA repair ATPase RecN
MKKLIPSIPLIVIALSVLAPASVSAQRQPLAGGAPLEQAGVSPAEIQRMFDAYALLQAQEQLQINDDQFSQFLTRFRALQDARRRALQERTRIVMELRRLLSVGQPEDTELKDRIRTLQDLDDRSSAEIRRAYDAIDQVLDARQQARFRVFEEQMERRKLELVTRARQLNRPRPQP